MTPEATGFLLSAAAASAALLGWVAVAAKRTWTDRSVGFALLLSAAAMLAISVLELLPPGLRDPATRQATILLLAAGFLAVPVLRWVLGRLLPSLGTAQSTALLVMIAIALHNIPEGMAVSTAVIAMGGTRRRALAYTGVSVVGEIIGAVIILAVGSTLSPTGAAMLLAFVAGIMVSLCVTQLIPAGLGLVTGASTERVALAAAHSQG